MEVQMFFVNSFISPYVEIGYKIVRQMLILVNINVINVFATVAKIILIK